MRLSYTQAAALETLAEPGGKWRGSRERGPAGTTIGALADRGLAEAKWADTPYRRLVGRLTEAGVAERDRRRARAA